MTLVILPGIVSAGGGGSGPYHADAVHWDGSDGLWLSINSLTSANGSNFSFSTWLKSDFATGPTIFAVDPQNSFSESMTCSSAPDFNIQCADITGSTDTLIIGGVPWTAGTWNHILFSASTNFDVGQKLAALYVNDIAIDLSSYLTDSSPAFSMVFNGLPFTVGGDLRNGDTLVGDMSDTWIGPNISLLTDNTISLTNRRKFISANGKPVNPSEFPAGAILFSGDASTFATNQGTGGAFTLSGTLINASSSPSD